MAGIEAEDIIINIKWKAIIPNSLMGHGNDGTVQRRLDELWYVTMDRNCLSCIMFNPFMEISYYDTA